MDYHRTMGRLKFQVGYFCAHPFTITSWRISMNDNMKNLFAAIDASDAEAFASHLADDVQFRFGNAPAVSGKDATRDAVAGFFGSIASLKHDVAAVDTSAETIYSHGFVTYTRHDGSTLRVPFCNVFNMNGDLIKDYLIFADLSLLYSA